jgi:hypothetical protein
MSDWSPPLSVAIPDISTARRYKDGAEPESIRRVAEANVF